MALQPITAAMTASAAGALPEVGAFALPALDGPTAITWDWKTGRVFGHIATWATCHVGYEGVCVTPPKEDDTYAWFNRHPVETSDGDTIAAGRITLGGRHAALALSASAAMSAYDTKTTAAHVRAYADEHGIVVAGVIEPGLTGADRAVLDRRKVSGDWRDIGSGLSLVEVLALSPGPRAHSEPGFPVVETHVGARGRQTALTASLGPEPTMTLASRPMSVEAIVRRTLAAERAETARLEAEATLARTLEADENSRAERAREALPALIGEE
jgi:hypothetical protein